MSTSGWVNKPVKPCEHPGRPEPRAADAGGVWYCAPCRTGFEVRAIDYMHDVMPGESRYSVIWERLP